MNLETDRTMAMDEGGLRECPFCGFVPAVLSDHEGWIVSCEDNDCPTQPVTETEPTEAEAIAAWNQRSPDNGLAEARALERRMLYFIECIAHADREGWNDATIDEARRIVALSQSENG